MVAMMVPHFALLLDRLLDLLASPCWCRLWASGRTATRGNRRRRYLVHGAFLGCFQRRARPAWEIHSPHRTGMPTRAARVFPAARRTELSSKGPRQRASRQREARLDDGRLGSGSARAELAGSVVSGADVAASPEESIAVSRGATKGRGSYAQGNDAAGRIRFLIGVAASLMASELKPSRGVSQPARATIPHIAATVANCRDSHSFPSYRARSGGDVAELAHEQGDCRVVMARCNKRKPQGGFFRNCCPNTTFVATPTRSMPDGRVNNLNEVRHTVAYAALPPRACSASLLFQVSPAPGGFLGGFTGGFFTFHPCPNAKMTKASIATPPTIPIT